MGKIAIGVSACLLGMPVRYDGNHAEDPYIVGTLGRYLELIGICPEAEAGLGVPREPMHLEGDPSSPKLVGVSTRRDLTEQLQKWADRKLEELKRFDLKGFIFKGRSPSCGMERVKVYLDKKKVVKKGRGVFAKAFMELFPLIPVEEDGRLKDPALRESFIERVFAYHRWIDLVSKDVNMNELVKFHTKNKYAILSHSPEICGKLGRLIAKGSGNSIKETCLMYGDLFMKALKLKATPKKHTNVLMHLFGFFKKDLSKEDKGELLDTIKDYYDGHLPLIVPITLIKHYARKYEKAYLKEQYYLYPDPVELKLRNHP